MTLPIIKRPGDIVQTSVTVKNTGEATWTFGIGFSCRSTYQEGSTIWNSDWANQRIVLPPAGDMRMSRLDPGASTTATLSFRIPDGFNNLFQFIFGVWKNMPPQPGEKSLAVYGWTTTDTSGRSIDVFQEYLGITYANEVMINQAIENLWLDYKARQTSYAQTEYNAFINEQLRPTGKPYWVEPFADFLSRILISESDFKTRNSLPDASGNFVGDIKKRFFDTMHYPELMTMWQSGQLTEQIKANVLQNIWTGTNLPFNYIRDNLTMFSVRFEWLPGRRSDDLTGSVVKLRSPQEGAAYAYLRSANFSSDGNLWGYNATGWIIGMGAVGGSFTVVPSNIDYVYIAAS